MGLDMYLTKKLYVGGKYEHRNVTGTVSIFMDNKQFDIPLNKLDSIELDVAYWRKANQIHNWFVNNVQGGEDDCKAYYVSVDQLKELRDTCHQVLCNHDDADSILPTEEGFFFGSTEYDEWYFEDLQYTIRMLDEALEDTEHYDFYYCSSW